MKDNYRNARKQKNQIIEKLLITDAGAQGKAIAKHNGMVVFIPFGAPGDTVDVEITLRKQNYYEGKIIKIHSPSPFRETPFCKHFGLCGGCQWQHISYRQQLSIKQKHVKDNFERIAKVENPVITNMVTFAQRCRRRMNIATLAAKVRKLNPIQGANS